MTSAESATDATLIHELAAVYGRVLERLNARLYAYEPEKLCEAADKAEALRELQDGIVFHAKVRALTHAFVDGGRNDGRVLLMDEGGGWNFGIERFGQELAETALRVRDLEVT
jgi:hypothetical protein